MFCTQCGKPYSMADKFCGKCGTPRSADAETDGMTNASFVPNAGKLSMFSAPAGQDVSPPIMHVDPASLPDWRTATDYVNVIGHPEVQNLVREAKGANPGGMSAEDFINVAKPLMKAVGADAVPLKLVMDIAQPMYAKMGVKTGSETRQGYKSAFGRTLAAVLCSMASRNQKLVRIDEGSDGCVLHAELPSTMFAYKSQMTLTLAQVPEGTVMTGAVTVPGQMSDWGHSKKVLAALHEDVLNFRSLQS